MQNIVTYVNNNRVLYQIHLDQSFTT